MQIGSSARKRGVSDEDIRHALRFPMLTTDEPASARRLVLGPDHAGNIVELVVLDPDTDPVVISCHARPAEVPSTVEQETMMPRTRAELERAAADAEAWLDSLNPDDVQWENPTDLRAIGYALEKVVDAERELANAVAAARARGRSWATIGTVLGVSKQSASSRYSERHAS